MLITLIAFRKELNVLIVSLKYQRIYISFSSGETNLDSLVAILSFYIISWNIIIGLLLGYHVLEKGIEETDILNPFVNQLDLLNSASLIKNTHARRACVYRWRVRNVLLARYKCWRYNKTDCNKHCAIFVVYRPDLEIFDVIFFWQLWGKLS